MQDDPPADSAAVAGYAVCGEGPWLLDELDVLTPGWASALDARMPVPRHTDAVIAARRRLGARSDPTGGTR